MTDITTLLQIDAANLGTNTGGAVDVGAALTALIASAISDKIDLGSTGEGSYLIDTTVVVPYQVSICGAGIRTKVKTKLTPSTLVMFACNTDGSGVVVTPYPSEMSSKISGMFIDGRASVGSQIVGFDFAGSQHFHDIHAGGIQTLIRQSDLGATSYSDLVTIERVGVFQQPTIDEYAISLAYTGDGVRIRQCLFSRYYDDGADGAIDPASGRRVRAIHLKYKTGSTIEDILNGDILIDNCDAIAIRSLHMEDGIVTFRESSGSLSDATFWMRSDDAGELSVVPLVIDYDTSPSLHPGVVTLRNISFQYHQEFRNEGYTITKHNFSVKQSPSVYQGVVSVENVYRAIHSNVHATGFGQKVGATCGIAAFDDYSHIASLRSEYVASRWMISADLGDLPASDNVLNPIEVSTEKNFNGATGTYYMRAQLLIDKNRLIGLAGAVERSAAVTNGGDAPVAVLTADARKNAIVRLYIGTATNSFDRYFDVPMLAGARLAYSGEDVCGFAPVSRAASAMSAINAGTVLSYSLRPGNTTATSEAYGNARVGFRGTPSLPTAGAWRKGDEVWFDTPSGGVGGYLRLTDCTLASPAHVLNTDWLAI